ncbi:MAG: phosphosulfolactate synthase, partial [Firmicutes bacterium]|nr:phosphosulfolactate synthase [Bacillota bacterium]
KLCNLSEKKIKLYHDNQVNVFFAGDISEIAYMQGVSEQFYQQVKNFGATAVEVSSAQVAMPLAAKISLIKMATGLGLKVVAEAGQKAHAEWTRSLSYILHQIEGYFEAGAWKVLVQGEGLTEGVDEIRDDILLNIASRFNLDDLIFQAKDIPSQMWFINNLGNEVSLDVDDDQVIGLELMRRGIRKRGLFGLVGNLG